jgi:hypothetical protein
MRLEEALIILECCVESTRREEHNLPGNVKVAYYVPKDAVQMVWNDLVFKGGFGEFKQFAAGEVVHYKGVKFFAS